MALGKLWADFELRLVFLNIAGFALHGRKLDLSVNWTCPRHGLGSKRGMLRLVLRLSEGPDGPGSQAMGDLGARRLLLERRAASLRERKEVKNEGKKPGGAVIFREGPQAIYYEDERL
jgi:hypothetical protein